MSNSKNQKGQALVLIVLGIVGLIALVALALDGGNAFMNRRHAQAAADASALAAALAKVNNQDWHLAGLARAASNAFINDGTHDTVTIVSPPGADCKGEAGPYAGNNEYIQVIIESNVDTFFAQIVGVAQTHSCVESIARAKLGVYSPLFFGSGIVATSCTASPAVGAGGSANITLLGSGIFSNSSSGTSVDIQKLDSLITPIDKGVMAVGGISVPQGYPSPLQTGMTQFPCPLPSEMLPTYTCDYNYGNFPPSGMTVVPSGVHCITGSFSKADLTGTGVTFVMLNQGIDWNGNAEMHLTAPTSGSTKGLLIYLPPSNSNEIRLNGTFDMDIVGTIFAPS